MGYSLQHLVRRTKRLKILLNRIPTLALSKSGKVEGYRPSSQPSKESSLASIILARCVPVVKQFRYFLRLAVGTMTIDT